SGTPAPGIGRALQAPDWYSTQPSAASTAPSLLGTPPGATPYGSPAYGAPPTYGPPASGSPYAPAPYATNPNPFSAAAPGTYGPPPSQPPWTPGATPYYQQPPPALGNGFGTPDWCPPQPGPYL